MRVLTSDEVRQIEVEAASRTDTSTSLLIQRAGYAVAQFCLTNSSSAQGDFGQVLVIGGALHQVVTRAKMDRSAGLFWVLLC